MIIGRGKDMTGKKIIPIFRPSMSEKEVKAVGEVLKSGWIGLGPKTEELEKKFSNYIGVKKALGMNSGTTALQVSLATLPIEEGDEVITSPLTFVSTAHIILHQGAKPVFADIQPDVLNIDPKDIERKISERTKAIIPVHFGGHPCDMNEILELAAKHNLYVIEDAAHACGAEYKGRKAGSFGDLGCFSFHAVKNLATGDGGMITTDREECHEKASKLRWLGIDKSTYERGEEEGYGWDYDVTHLGFKAHMNDITAAIGLIQFEKLERMNERRRELAERYDEAFEDLGWIKPLDKRDYVKSSQHNYVVKVLGADRNKLIAHLSRNKISAGVHYKPLYHHSFYQKIGIKSECPNAENIWKKIVTLPLYPDLSYQDQRRVIEKVKEFGE